MLLLVTSIFLESVKRVEEITGKKVGFEKVNLLDKDALDKLFEKVCVVLGEVVFLDHQEPQSSMWCAGQKAWSMYPHENIF